MRSLVPGLTLLLLGASLASTTATAQVPRFADQFQRTDVVTVEQDRRDLFGFDSVSGRTASYRLEVGEAVHFSESRGRVGLVLTNRRALGIGPGTGFREVRFPPNEVPPEFGLVEDQVALVVTSKRILGFIGNGGQWVEEGLSPSESAQAIRVGSGVAVVATNRRALGLGTNLGGFVALDLQVREVLESFSVQDTLATLRTNKRILVFGAPRGTWSIQDRAIR
jgi:hypothetical protein